jgi:hypothetical protein
VLPAHRHGGDRIGDEEVKVIAVEGMGRSELIPDEREHVDDVKQRQ